MTRHKRGYQVQLREGGVAPATVTLKIPNPLPPARIRVPEVELVVDGGPMRLEWWSGDVQESPPVRGCLPAFIKLPDARPATIEAFAKTWGVLGICRDGLPGVHLGCEPLSSAERWWESTPDAWQRSELSDDQRRWFDPAAAKPGAPRRYWEDLDAWRYLARRLRAIMVLAAALRRGDATSEEDWIAALPAERGFNELQGWDQPFALPVERWHPRRRKTLEARLRHYRGDPATRVSEQRGLAMVATDVLIEGAVYPRVSWEDSVAPQLEIGLAGPRVAASLNAFFGPYEWPANNLYSVLASQVVAAITGVTSPGICDKCHEPYDPTTTYSYRRDRDNICPDCRIVRRQERNRASERRRAEKRRREESPKETSAKTANKVHRHNATGDGQPGEMARRQRADSGGPSETE